MPPRIDHTGQIIQKTRVIGYPKLREGYGRNYTWLTECLTCGKRKRGHIREAVFDRCRCRKVSRLHSINGWKYTITEWCRICQMPAEAVRTRLQLGWTLKKALSIPIMTCGGNVKKKIREAKRRSAFPVNMGSERLG